MTTFSKKILAVDFDGTLVSNRYPNVGEFNWEVVNYVKSKKATGSLPTGLDGITTSCAGFIWNCTAMTTCLPNFVIR